MQMAMHPRLADRPYAALIAGLICASRHSQRYWARADRLSDNAV